MRFRAAPAAERVAEPIDALVAVYHRRSGETHLLAQPLPEILAALDTGEADVDTLLARLDVPPGEAARAAVAARLAELEASGLVERLCGTS